MKNNLDILIFSWRGPGHPNAGGAEISTHEHAKGWVKKGHKVTLFTSLYKGGRKEEVIDGVNIIRQGGQVFGVHLKAFVWYLFKDHSRFDLVIDQFHGIPFFTPFYVRVKKIAFIHEVAKEVWKLNPWPFPFNLIPSVAGFFFEPFIFNFYKKVPFMTVSNSTKKDLEQFGIPSKSIQIIHNGVNIPSAVSFVKDDNITLIFLGALAKDKGADIVIKLFSYISQKLPQSKLWFVGKGDKVYSQKLKSQISELGLGSKISFFGYVDEVKKFELLKRSHLLINLSIREGWGIVVLEAAAMGTPAAAFDVPGLRDSIRNNITGILSPKGRVEELGVKIELLLNNKNKYKEMCNSAILWSKKFTWEKSVSDSLELLKRVAG